MIRDVCLTTRLMKSIRLVAVCRFAVLATLAMGSISLSGLTGLNAQAAEPLHVQIDRLIAAKHPQNMGPNLATDAEFLRRAYLDFTGRIPTSTEAKAFLQNESKDRRTQLIDQLLASPEYPARMESLLHNMLMERMGDNEHWQNFLREAMRQNLPWDKLVAAIFNPDTEDKSRQGAAFFLSKRLEKYGQNPVDLPGLTRDVGRMFLGIDVQCAQCHDHLMVDEYKQQHYQGLFAFVSHLSTRTDLKYPAVSEKLVTEPVPYMSVFDKEPLTTGPRLPHQDEVVIPVFAKGEEYEVPPDRKTRFPGIPKFSPLTLLSQQLPTPENDLFVRNIVNRLWFVLVGRGIVHPLDLQHADNPPSHPELLDLLSEQMRAHNFDIKWMLRELALTETYQRSSRLPEGLEQSPPEQFLVAIERPLAAEQLLASMLYATGEQELYQTAQLPPVETVEDAEAETPAATEADAKQPKKDPGAEARTKLKDLEGMFIKAFANPPREPELDFNPSVQSALFILNGDTIQAWMKPQSDNLIGRLEKLEAADAFTDELFLSVLSRYPEDEERQAVVQYLASRNDDRSRAVSNLVWSLMASTEFCVNH